MATITRSALTLVDLAKQKGPDGNLLTIAEILEESNPILEDMPMIEANGASYHKITRRLSLPAGTHRRLNQGVPNSVSSTLEVTEGLAMLEGYAEVDKALVDIAPNPAEFRMNEARAHIEGMSQTMAGVLFYGNAGTDPEQIDGLATRMGVLDSDGLVIGAGATTGDMTSVYAVQWGLGQVTGIYPKGAAASVGVTHTDKGQVTLQDANGYNYEGYRDHFQVRYGLAVHDTRCLARYANIQTSGESYVFSEDELIRLLNRMKNGGRGATIYVNRTIKTQMEIALNKKSNVHFVSGRGNGLSGDEILYFRGHPVKMVDAILDTESVVA